MQLQEPGEQSRSDGLDLLASVFDETLDFLKQRICRLSRHTLAESPRLNPTSFAAGPSSLSSSWWSGTKICSIPVLITSAAFSSSLMRLGSFYSLRQLSQSGVAVEKLTCEKAAEKRS